MAEDEKTHRFPLAERAECVRRQRKELRLSQLALAKRVGCSQPIISRFEASLADVSPEVMRRIQEALSEAYSEVQLAAWKANADLGKASNLIPMRSLLPGTVEYEQFWKEYPQRLRWADPKYQTALLDEITELRGEVSRLNFRLGQIADVVQHAAELAQDATAEEGARILEKQTAPEKVSHE